MYAPLNPSESLGVRTNYTEDSAFWILPIVNDRTNPMNNIRSPGTHTGINSGASAIPTIAF